VTAGREITINGGRPVAVKYLNEALKVEGASEKAREEATKSLQGPKQQENSRSF
jgi:hypothetical protein